MISPLQPLPLLPPPPGRFTNQLLNMPSLHPPTDQYQLPPKCTTLLISLTYSIHYSHVPKHTDTGRPTLATALRTVLLSTAQGVLNRFTSEMKWLRRLARSCRLQSCRFCCLFWSAPTAIRFRVGKVLLVIIWKS